MKLDHVLYAAPDLAEAGARFERDYGLTAYPGGLHPGFGTGNLIIPLGKLYVELIAVADEAVARTNPLGSRVAEIASSGGGWMGWVVRVDDLDARAAARDVAVFPGIRTTTSGEQLSWRLAGIERMIADPAYPFFIAWDDMSVHPGIPEQPGASLAWIEVGAEAGELRAWLGEIPDWVRVVDDEPRGPRALAVGELILR